MDRPEDYEEDKKPIKKRLRLQETPTTEQDIKKSRLEETPTTEQDIKKSRLEETPTTEQDIKESRLVEMHSNQIQHMNKVAHYLVCEARDPQVAEDLLLKLLHRTGDRERWGFLIPGHLYHPYFLQRKIIEKRLLDNRTTLS